MCVWIFPSNSSSSPCPSPARSFSQCDSCWPGGECHAEILGDLRFQGTTLLQSNDTKHFAWISVRLANAQQPLETRIFPGDSHDNVVFDHVIFDGVHFWSDDITPSYNESVSAFVHWTLLTRGPNGYTFAPFEERCVGLNILNVLCCRQCICEPACSDGVCVGGPGAKCPCQCTGGGCTGDCPKSCEDTSSGGSFSFLLAASCPTPALTACSPPCGVHGSCIAQFGVCQCSDGYTGADCSVPPVDSSEATTDPQTLPGSTENVGAAVEDPRLSNGAIIGISIGCAALAVIAIIVAVFLMQRRRARQANQAFQTQQQKEHDQAMASVRAQTALTSTRV